jgi:hypothetical protein
LPSPGTYNSADEAVTGFGFDVEATDHNAAIHEAI